MALLTPEEQARHDKHAQLLMGEQMRAAFDSMTPEELRQALKTAKMILEHKENEFEHVTARIKYQIGYIQGKLSNIYI